MLARSSSNFEGAATERLESGMAPSVECARAVRMALQGQEERGLHRVARRSAGPALQPRALLAIIAYYYARGIYESREVARRLRHDNALGWNGLDSLPGAAAIGRFRDLNPDVVRRCLTSTLHYLGQEKLRQGLVTKLHDNWFEEEANRRLTMAMFLDSLELEAARGQPQVAL